MTLLDRVVRWGLDSDGNDFYGDERERLRWYEGIATAASLQWLAIPWAAAVLVWPLGMPSVLPLTVMLVLLVVPMAMCMAYVHRRWWTPRCTPGPASGSCGASWAHCHT